MPTTGTEVVSTEAKKRQRYIHLANLPVTASYSDIKEIFKSCELSEDRILKRGTDAFVAFEDYKSAEDCLPKKDWLLNGHYLELSVVDLWDLRKILIAKSKRVLEFNTKILNQESVEKYILKKHRKRSVDMSVTNGMTSPSSLLLEDKFCADSELAKEKPIQENIKLKTAKRVIDIESPFVFQVKEIDCTTETCNIDKSPVSDYVDVKETINPSILPINDEKLLNSIKRNANPMDVLSESTVVNGTTSKNVYVLHNSKETKVLNGTEAKESNSSYSEDESNLAGEQKITGKLRVNHTKKRFKRIHPTNVNDEQFKKLPVFHPEDCFSVKKIKLGENSLSSY